MRKARTAPPDYRQRLQVETPEHVILDLEIAGVGSRALAALLDVLILIGAGIGVFIVLVIFAGVGVTIGSLGGALLLCVGFTVWTGYLILFEGLRQGQTPGKRIVGIRVVSDTGNAVSLGAAAARNLLRIADFLPPPYLIGAVLVALHPRGKRLGDMVAGTVVARDRPFEMMPPRTAPRAATRQLSLIPELTDAEFRVLAQFEARQAQLSQPARLRLASAIARRLADHPPPAGVGDLDHLLELYRRERERREGTPAWRGSAAAAAFAARKRPRWAEFQQLADRAARHGLDSFASHELPDFAARYREVAADLARARTYGVDEATLEHLERLAAAGHNALYRDERGTWRRVWEVLARECPAAIRQARGYVAVACLAFLLPAGAGYLLMRDQPALALDLLPEIMIERADAGAERMAEGRRYVDVAPEDRPLMASGIITNNVRVAIACFAGGIFLGVGSLVLLGFNGLSIGAAAGHFANRGLLGYLMEFILGHGLLELFAIWVAGAAGFLLGRSLVSPGDMSRGDALVLSGRTAVRMVGGAAVLLVVAGLIEGFISAGEGDVTFRAAASVGSLAFLAAYLVNGRVRGAG
ncbi:MAG TPA: stage II sporulation protein M [Gemmatimonadales bacterium]|nr:stage II sporulation protein M [Gemmatimonadales bacterium]